MKVEKLRNWTIPPVLGVSPDSLCDEWRWVATFPRLVGNTKSLRRIVAPHERIPADDHGCCMLMDADIITSRIVDITCVDGEVLVDTVEGSRYQLEGKPRPSFDNHCHLMGVDCDSEDALQQLVEKLQ